MIQWSCLILCQPILVSTDYSDSHGYHGSSLAPSTWKPLTRDTGDWTWAFTQNKGLNRERWSLLLRSSLAWGQATGPPGPMLSTLTGSGSPGVKPILTGDAGASKLGSSICQACIYLNEPPLFSQWPKSTGTPRPSNKLKYSMRKIHDHSNNSLVLTDSASISD